MAQTTRFASKRTIQRQMVPKCCSQSVDILFHEIVVLSGNHIVEIISNMHDMGYSAKLFAKYWLTIITINHLLSETRLDR